MVKLARKKRDYLILLEKSIDAIHTAVESFNKVYGNYKLENTLILLTNGWELLGKSILIKNHKNIYTNKKEKLTISAEFCVNMLFNEKLIDDKQADVVQQVISLRNRASHFVLPKVPLEIQHHLFFYACKIFKDLVSKEFPSHKHKVSKNYLSISFDQLHTYSDKVRKLISGLKKSSKGEKELIWLLERGVSFRTLSNYMSQDKFEQLLKKRKTLSHLNLKNFIDEADMVRIVPVQAPGGFTADVVLRKGSKKMKEALPVTIKKTDIEQDYPYLTKDLANKLNKNVNFVAKIVSNLGLRGNRDYHQSIRASKASYLNRYSDACLSHLKDYLIKNPSYNPHKG